MRAMLLLCAQKTEGCRPSCDRSRALVPTFRSTISREVRRNSKDRSGFGPIDRTMADGTTVPLSADDGVSRAAMSGSRCIGLANGWTVRSLDGNEPGACLSKHAGCLTIDAGEDSVLLGSATRPSVSATIWRDSKAVRCASLGVSASAAVCRPSNARKTVRIRTDSRASVGRQTAAYLQRPGWRTEPKPSRATSKPIP